MSSPWARWSVFVAASSLITAALVEGSRPVADGCPSTIASIVDPPASGNASHACLTSIRPTFVLTWALAAAGLIALIVFFILEAHHRPRGSVSAGGLWDQTAVSWGGLLVAGEFAVSVLLTVHLLVLAYGLSLLSVAGTPS